MMDMAIQKGGLVIAVEADRYNYVACQHNLSLYKKVKDRDIELVNAAAWNHTNGVIFSSEGSMGSSVAEIVGADRGENTRVPTVTLVSLANRYQLSRVDFIKCDIEGGEFIALNSPEFFAKFRPRIVVECHLIDGVSTAERCINLLKDFDYICELRGQHGYPLPLLFCTASGRR